MAPRCAAPGLGAVPQDAPDPDPDPERRFADAERMRVAFLDAVRAAEAPVEGARR